MVLGLRDLLQSVFGLFLEFVSPLSVRIVRGIWGIASVMFDLLEVLDVVMSKFWIFDMLDSLLMFIFCF